jgi:hypothetical protein
MEYNLVKSERTLSCHSIFTGRVNCTRHLGRYSDFSHTCEYCCLTSLCNLETSTSELAYDCLMKLAPVKSAATNQVAMAWWPFIAFWVLLLTVAVADRSSFFEVAYSVVQIAPRLF